MTISLAAVGAKITAAMFNALAGLANAQAQTQVVPTVSGTGITVTALGTVTVTNVSGSISLDGMFTGTYDNYVIETDLLFSAASSLQWQLRSAGTADTAANYLDQYLAGTGSTATANVTSAATFGNMCATGLEVSSQLKMYRPALTTPTRAVATSMTYISSTSETVGVYASRNQQSKSFDGMQFNITGSGVTATGKIRVYGINNG